MRMCNYILPQLGSQWIPTKYKVLDLGSEWIFLLLWRRIYDPSGSVGKLWSSDL